MANTHPKKKKILLLITRLDRGGSAELTLQLARGLVKSGFEVLLISGKTKEPLFDPQEFAVKSGFQLYFIKSLVRSLNPFLDLISLFKIFTKIQMYLPDILHTNSSKAGILGRFAAHFAGVPIIVHSPHGHIFYGYYNRLISRFFIALETIAAGFSDIILNLTECGRQDHIRKKIGLPSKFVVSSCGVDINPFINASSNNEITGIKSHSFTVGWVGRIEAIKNLPLLINAIAILNEEKLPIEYIIIGDGKQSIFCKTKVKKLGLSNIRFLGYRKDITQLLSLCDLFVLTSLNEGFGRVIVEAMASGLPIVATNVGGVPEIIINNINGLLVPSNNPIALANAIRTLFKNEQLRHTISMNNKKKADIFSLNTYISNVIGIYIKLLNKKITG